jgi:hypothetical protein
MGSDCCDAVFEVTAGLDSKPAGSPEITSPPPVLRLGVAKGADLSSSSILRSCTKSIPESSF